MLTSAAWRYISEKDDRTFLVYTDGACKANGRQDQEPRGGCGIRPVTTPSWGQLSFKLEAQGPDGRFYIPTSNRAELRAVDLALDIRPWSREGFEKMVIATDSQHVVLGATVWCKNWLVNGWLNSHGAAVANQDLWTALLTKIAKLRNEGVSVYFWYIPREFNTAADRLAREGADMEDNQGHTHTASVGFGGYW
ncbi:ribonuclease H-like domain-containing protein [Elsinoe ampelina]|uniref:ribonuclease H n=1 Tax=Elsinoe ampelina TaxID=302913 RepID=A0A6A6GQ00_9PEZI|nr:ribonuclease H-like domain-containing protein [Elsinoe ampelina]